MPTLELDGCSAGRGVLIVDADDDLYRQTCGTLMILIVVKSIIIIQPGANKTGVM